MPMDFSFFSILILIADLYAVYNVWNSAATTGAKIVWSIVIFLLPVLGFLAWIFFGPRAQ